MPADMKHEKQTSPNGETSHEEFELPDRVGDEEPGAGLENTKESQSPGQSALSSVQHHNESQPTSSSLAIKGELWPKVKVFPFITGQTFGAYEAIMEKVNNNKNYWPNYLSNYWPNYLSNYWPNYLSNYWPNYLSNFLPSSWLPPTLEEKQSPEESSVIIVFCPITSRVGSDVESAMTNPQVSSLNKPVILVLMHHTRDPDYSTAGTKWSEVYDNVKLEVHILFHETKPGLLTCQQNSQAIEAIDQKLNEYST
ncbi:uncharacterized protein LOC103461251 [Poecilia reticulata]|uniref:uncharacterized protein LOC103461251 n=1 Tax=Poecilia reticulata TaxID=8081 RepID=UPI0004A3E0C1|nr:PREDICTED: uncharacterized protein LOC103461251 [Poecilia reticulata]